MRLNLLLGTLLLLALLPAARATAGGACQTCTIVLENAQVRFVVSEYNFGLISAEHKALGKSFSFADKKLWRIVSVNGQAPDSGPSAISSGDLTPGTASNILTYTLENVAGGKKLTLTWDKVKNSATKVTATITLLDGEDRATWGISVTPPGDRAVWRVDYPFLDIQKGSSPQKEFFAFAHNVITNPAEEAFEPNNDPRDLGGGSILDTETGRGMSIKTYPGVYFMQFGAFYREEGAAGYQGNPGLLLIVEDPDVNTKRFNSYGTGQAFRYYVTHYPQTMSTNGRAYTMPYTVSFGIFTGDWYDASRLYRAWTLRQPWATAPLPRQTLNPYADATDLGFEAWLDLMAAAVQAGGGNPADPAQLTGMTRDSITAVQDFFSQGPSFTQQGRRAKLMGLVRAQELCFPPALGYSGAPDVPESAKSPECRQLSRDLIAQGVYSMVGGDIKLMTADNPNNIPAVAAAKSMDFRGAVIEDKAGGLLDHTMRPNDPGWANLHVGNIQGADALYSPLVVGMFGKPTPAFDFGPANPRRGEGGSYWYQAVEDNLYRPIAGIADFLVTEGAHDHKMNVVSLIKDEFARATEGAGAGKARLNGLIGGLPIPVSRAVQGDRVFHSGSGGVWEISSLEPNRWAVQHGMSFSWGHGLDITIPAGATASYFTADPQRKKDYEFLRQIVEFQRRPEYRKYMFAELLRPPVIDAGAEIQVKFNVQTKQGDVLQPFSFEKVLGQAFLAQDGSVGVMLVNVVEEAPTATFVVDRAQWQLWDDQYSIVALTPSGTRVPLGTADFLSSATSVVTVAFSGRGPLLVLFESDDVDGDGIPNSQDRCGRHDPLLVEGDGCPSPVLGSFQNSLSSAPGSLASSEDAAGFQVGAPQAGRISFTGPVDLVRYDQALGEYVGLDIDQAVDIASGRASVDTQAFPELNAPARIELFNIGVANPLILKDGQPCSGCRIESYQRGLTLAFTVPGFSAYSVGEGAACGDGYCASTETTQSCAADCPAAGPVCGNGVCEGGETSQSCVQDCGSVCGNGICESDEAATCSQDCGVCQPGQKQACGESQGACEPGTQTCVNGQWAACTGGVGPAPEACDGLDNNCDGQADEGCPAGSCTSGQTRACGSSVGICTEGTQACANGQWSACVGDVAPGTELCDNQQDDDCDGQTDEGCQAGSCSNGQQDPGEAGVDCGGTCPGKCDKKWLPYLWYGVTGAVILIIGIAVVLHAARRKRSPNLVA